MSYFETLSESDELVTEDTMCDGVSSATCSKGKSSAKNSTLLNHFTVTKHNNHNTDTADHNSHCQISNPHSSGDEGTHDPVMSQEEIDHLFTDHDMDTWFDDIT